MTSSTWLGFFAVSWLISLSPGAGAVSCMTAGMRYGVKRGFWNILGLQTGIIAQVAICGLGLGAVLAASATAFTAVKWCGALYLCWLGITQWRAPAERVTVNGRDEDGTPAALYRRGVLVNLTNPKAVMFMLAVLPQFIDPHRPLWPQYAICTLTLMLTDVVVMGAYTGLAAKVLLILRTPRQIRWINRTFGSLFVAAGLLLATFKRTA